MILLILLIIISQCIMAVLLYQLQWTLPWSIALFFLPFGIGLFLIQLLYYERRFPDWRVSFSTKLRLKYMYILTFFEFVFLYLLLFVVK
ncbi:hypothetical protein [Staphylococcus ratti]|uniref:Uncharacterized protein n=1 Tax=Staphylococcus ratti TaxID=2892440 RepID=A0ABY3PBV9_9STAP|nr:hypothetical protein [Staphylococcus ratti]UEX89795.1 hypothetical protein LN051_09525 [Staphylococcus ratti]